MRPPCPCLRNRRGLFKRFPPQFVAKCGEDLMITIVFFQSMSRFTSVSPICIDDEYEL